MPEKETVKRAEEDLKEGKSPSTAAGEFVHEEIEHVREGKHGARSPQQAIAIGLSKARRAGIPLAPPKKGRTSEQTRKQAKRETEAAKSSSEASPSPRKSRARKRVLKREPRTTASRRALSTQTRTAAQKRTPQERQQAAKKAVTTKRKSGRAQAAKKAAATRARKRTA